MNFTKNLYKLNAFVSPKPWGYENWIVSTMKDCESFFEDNKKPVSTTEIMNEKLPILIKLIQANQMLSVQVHPNEEYAQIHENSHGKTECWYILDANENAQIISGLNENYTKEKFCKALQNNNLDELLIYSKIKKGDFIFIPAGTVHAIMGGLRILEIQQASDITYRLFDWGRGRELHIKQALDVMKPVNAQIESDFCGSFECEEFGLEKIELKNETKLAKQKNCWQSFIVLSGEGIIESENEKYNVKQEDVFFASPNSKISISGNLQIMQVWY